MVAARVADISRSRCASVEDKLRVESRDDIFNDGTSWHVGNGSLPFTIGAIEP